VINVFVSRFQRRGFHERGSNGGRRRFGGLAFVYPQEGFNMSSGTQITKNGAVTGTGANLDVLTVGYKPRRVELFNQTGLVLAYWTDSMTEGRGLKQITAGTLSQIAAGAGITPLSNGFRIGNDSDVNVAGELVHWVAHE
jgi:hypothetical protein